MVLSGCSVMLRETPSATDPKAGARMAASWSARGNMVFQCDYDSEGFYWRFLRQEGTLKTPAGRKAGTLEAGFAVKTTAGEVLRGRPVSSSGGTRSRAPDTLFEVAAPPQKGVLAGIRLIERHDTEGGMPLAACSASQRGKILRAPFTATYTFYR